MSLSRDELLHYSRHLALPEVGLEGQERLKRARVLCVGAGGLGSPLTLYLAAAGVGTIGVVEFDDVDLTNLQRQILYATSDVGRPKIEAAAERLRGINPSIRVAVFTMSPTGRYSYRPMAPRFPRRISPECNTTRVANRGVPAGAGSTPGFATISSAARHEMLFVTENGQALRFSETKIRAMGRQAAGVTAIKLKKDDAVTSMDVVEKDGALLVVTSGEYGKQTPLKDYSAKGRATGGIATIDHKALKEIGKIVSARVVQKADDLTIITSNGVAIRIKNKDVKQAGRATKGVHLIKPQEGDYVASVARIAAEDLKKAGAQMGEDEKVDPQPQLI